MKIIASSSAEGHVNDQSEAEEGVGSRVIVVALSAAKVRCLSVVFWLQPVAFKHNLVLLEFMALISNPSDK